jgi:hypothetical protein
LPALPFAQAQAIEFDLISAPVCAQPNLKEVVEYAVLTLNNGRMI